jgi:hypothetical protein
METKMKLTHVLLKLAGKDNFVLDERISAGYLVRICWKYGWMLIRGIMQAAFYQNIGFSLIGGKLPDDDFYYKK